MDQDREDHRGRGSWPFRLPPAWVLFLLALFAMGMVVIVADLLERP